MYGSILVIRCFDVHVPGICTCTLCYANTLRMLPCQATTVCLHVVYIVVSVAFPKYNTLKFSILIANALNKLKSF